MHAYLSQEAFLPQGYPESVSDDYLAYQIWDTIQVRVWEDVPYYHTRV